MAAVPFAVALGMLVGMGQPAPQRGSAREQAVAWLRANNAFGPKHRMVEQLAKALDEIDGNKAFFLRLGTRQVKSRNPTLLAGRFGDFQVFEVAPPLAGKWVPELMTEFKTTCSFVDVLDPAPLVLLDNVVFDHAFSIDAREKLTGSINYRKFRKQEGNLGLRLMYMDGDYTYTRSNRLRKNLAGDKGALNFSFFPLVDGSNKLSGLVPVFVELCAFPPPGHSGKTVVLSNSLAGLIKVVESK